jgi:insertion element IS1 protein InsB
MWTYPPLSPPIFPASSGLQRAFTRDQRADYRYGAQWQRHPRYRTRLGHQHCPRAKRTQKKESTLISVYRSLLDLLSPGDIEVVIRRADEAEVDEMWSFVKRKKEPRWLWHAIDHRSGQVLAYVFGRRQDEVFLKLKALLEPFGITRYSTDYWGAYTRHLDAEEHQPGKRNTQQIERKHLTLRTRIKRLTRKTICFSKSIQMHDIVIGLFVNRYEFGLLL